MPSEGCRVKEASMQTWDAITSRRNVRSFADRPIPVAELDQILEAGPRAPGAQNPQATGVTSLPARRRPRGVPQGCAAAGPVAGAALPMAAVRAAGDSR